MTLADLASLGSFVSAIAVLTSLIFLFLQMRQMTEQVRQAERNQRSALTQGATARLSDITIKLTEPALSDLHYRAMSDAKDLSSADIMKLVNLVIVWVQLAMDAWILHREGLIDDLMYESAMAPVKVVFTTPVYRSIWPMARAGIPRHFREVWEKELTGIAVRRPVDLVQQYKLNRDRLGVSDTAAEIS